MLITTGYIHLLTKVLLSGSIWYWLVLIILSDYCTHSHFSLSAAGIEA